MNAYDIGKVVRCSATFTNDDVPADPTTIVFKYQDPSEDETSLTYGVDAEVVKDDTGDYHVDVTVDEAGVWYYRFEGTGAVVAAAEDAFYAAQSQF